MNTSALARLLDNCSVPLDGAPTEFPALTQPVSTIFESRNGFYAFERALHVRSLRDALKWNEPGRWRAAYPHIDNDLFFFAEDVFGNQFSMDSGGRVGLFGAVTEEIAQGVEGWARAILDDFEYLSGHPLAHEYQKTFGVLPWGYRLIGKTPFILGGEYRLDNLVAVRDIDGMHARAEIANATRGRAEGDSLPELPPGYRRVVSLGLAAAGKPNR